MCLEFIREALPETLKEADELVAEMGEGSFARRKSKEGGWHIRPGAQKGATHETSCSLYLFSWRQTQGAYDELR
jgi:hypothetical protein